MWSSQATDHQERLFAGPPLPLVYLGKLLIVIPFFTPQKLIKYVKLEKCRPTRHWTKLPLDFWNL